MRDHSVIYPVAIQTRWDWWILSWDRIIYWSKLDPGRRFIMAWPGDPDKAAAVFVEIAQ